MDIKNRRTGIRYEKLSFRFSALFILISAAMLLLTGIYSYNDHLFTERAHCRLRMIRAIRSDKSAQDVFDRADNEMYGNKVQMKAARR